MSRKKPLSALFLTFARIGLFTFGGGYAMIGLIEDQCVERKKWITHDEMMNITVVAESTPGPIAINCATYVGYQRAGLAGALAATIGIVLPAFVILFLISMFLDQFLSIGWIASAFRGIRIAVALIIAEAGVNMLRKMPKKPLPVAIACSALFVMLLIHFLSLRFSSIALMLLAAAVSLALGAAGLCKGGGKA